VPEIWVRAGKVSTLRGGRGRGGARWGDEPKKNVTGILFQGEDSGVRGGMRLVSEGRTQVGKENKGGLPWGC